VVDVVVARVVGGAGFADEVAEFAEERGAELRVFRAVGDYVDVVLGGDLGGEGELVEVTLTGDDGGVFKLLDGGSGEVGEAALGCCGSYPSVGVSAVPTPQPAGTFTDGWMAISFTGVFAGYRRSFSHSRTASSALSRAVTMQSRCAWRVVTPAGTVTWNS
jgi:hypothetical protein